MAETDGLDAEEEKTVDNLDPRFLGNSEELRPNICRVDVQ